jgi:diguanylate cyclase (GGDEF)-like protein
VTEHVLRRRWWTSLAVQTAALALVTMVVIGAVAVVPHAFSADATDQLTTMIDKYERPLIALQRVQSELDKETPTFAALTVATPDTLDGALLASTAQNTVVQASWEKFARYHPVLPGEAASRAQFVAVRAQAQDLAARGLGQEGRVSSPEWPVMLATARVRVADLSRQYQEVLGTTLAAAHQSTSTATRVSLEMGAAAVGLVGFGFFVIVTVARRRERTLRALDVDRAKEWAQRDLENRLQRGLAMLDEETPCYPVVAEAVRVGAPSMATELLVADSSQAHFRQVLETRDDTPACRVMAPGQCPAASGGQTQLWPASDAIDACPFLRELDTGRGASVCVPVSIAGKTIGVLHATGDEPGPLDRGEVAGLELVARQTGERVGVLRAFAQSQTQAHTDPLTGLMNRRSLENAVTELVDEGTSYVVVFADLDHFKMLNDVHGHETGDRALRLFSRILRDSVRPGDVPARFGGEEFVVVLPACAMSDAVAVIERVRDRLRHTTAEGSVPAFTASYGLASGDDIRFDEAVAAADTALLLAKAKGRDRIVIAGPDPDPEPDVLVPVPA